MTTVKLNAADTLINAAKNLNDLDIAKAKKLDLLASELTSCMNIGYTHDKIVGFLGQGGLEISRQVFSNYLTRRSKSKSELKKVQREKSTEPKEKTEAGFKISKNELSKYS